MVSLRSVGFSFIAEEEEKANAACGSLEQAPERFISPENPLRGTQTLVAKLREIDLFSVDKATLLKDPPAGKVAYVIEGIGLDPQTASRFIEVRLFGTGQKGTTHSPEPSASVQLSPISSNKLYLLVDSAVAQTSPFATLSLVSRSIGRLTLELKVGGSNYKSGTRVLVEHNGGTTAQEIAVENGAVVQRYVDFYDIEGVKKWEIVRVGDPGEDAVFAERYDPPLSTNFVIWEQTVELPSKPKGDENAEPATKPPLVANITIDQFSSGPIPLTGSAVDKILKIVYYVEAEVEKQVKLVEKELKLIEIETGRAVIIPDQLTKSGAPQHLLVIFKPDANQKSKPITLNVIPKKEVKPPGGG
jgi:hypothetical protein